jgi:hypothetical protein
VVHWSIFLQTILLKQKYTNILFIQKSLISSFQNPAGQLPNLELNIGEDFYADPGGGGGGGGTALTPPDATLLASTIDGTLVAIDQVKPCLNFFYKLI